MDRGAEKESEIEKIRKCKKCGRELKTYIQIQRGLCARCLLEEYRSQGAQYDIREEMNIAGIRIRKGDIVRVTLGRNREVIGEFVSWSNHLYAMVVKTEEGITIVPYKYIKAMQLPFTKREEE